jgi:hypothetical protein
MLPFGEEGPLTGEALALRTMGFCVDWREACEEIASNPGFSKTGMPCTNGDEGNDDMFDDIGFAGDRRGDEKYAVSTCKVLTSFARLDVGITARSKVVEVKGAVFGGEGTSATLFSKIPSRDLPRCMLNE